METLTHEQLQKAAQQKPLHEFPATVTYKWIREGQTKAGQQVQMAHVTVREDGTGKIIDVHMEIHVDGLAYAYAETVGHTVDAWEKACNEDQVITAPLF